MKSLAAAWGAGGHAGDEEDVGGWVWRGGAAKEGRVLYGNDEGGFAGYIPAALPSMTPLCSTLLAYDEVS
jgi:hypothetical protein